MPVMPIHLSTILSFLPLFCNFSTEFAIYSKNFCNFAALEPSNYDSSQKKQVMQEIGRTARSVAPMAKRILLFGSQARGDAREDSDWDVLVLLDKDRIRLEDIDNVSYPPA